MPEHAALLRYSDRELPGDDDSREEASYREKLEELSARLKVQETVIEKLVDVLIGRGALAPGHRKLFEKVAAQARRVSLPQVRLSSTVDKYAVSGPDIDCASLLHLCGARCCRLEPSLAQQDLDEGKLEWETKRPYVLKRASDGYCHYIAKTGGCGCYDIRPASCREFDCREDARIWIDFENKVPVPLSYVRDFEESGVDARGLESGDE